MRKLDDFCILTDKVRNYYINGVNYEVHTVFSPTKEDNGIDNKVFRIVETQSTQLIENQSSIKIDNEYTCLGCGKEEKHAVQE